MAEEDRVGRREGKDEGKRKKKTDLKWKKKEWKEVEEGIGKAGVKREGDEEERKRKKVGAQQGGGRGLPITT